MVPLHVLSDSLDIPFRTENRSGRKVGVAKGVARDRSDERRRGVRREWFLSGSISSKRGHTTTS